MNYKGLSVNIYSRKAKQLLTLLSKTNKVKEKIIEILKQCYENEIYNSIDIRDITKNTNVQIITNNLTKSTEKDYNIFK